MELLELWLQPGELQAGTPGTPGTPELQQELLELLPEEILELRSLLLGQGLGQDIQSGKGSFRKVADFSDLFPPFP